MRNGTKGAVKSWRNSRMGGLLKAKLSCSDGGSYRVLKKVLELRRDGREAMPIKASRGKKDFFSPELWLRIKNENTSAPDCRNLSLRFLFPERFVLMQHIFPTLSMKTDSFLQVFFLLFVSKAVCSKIRCAEWCSNRLFKGHKELCVQISLRSVVLKRS